MATNLFGDDSLCKAPGRMIYVGKVVQKRGTLLGPQYDGLWGIQKSGANFHR